jgi:hypothetical protein
MPTVLDFDLLPTSERRVCIGVTPSPTAMKEAAMPTRNGAAIAPQRAASPNSKATDLASGISAVLEDAETSESRRPAVPLDQRLAFTIPEAARLIGCCPNGLRGWIDAGTGPKTFHLGRKHLVLREELERWLKERAGGAK